MGGAVLVTAESNHVTMRIQGYVPEKLLVVLKNEYGQLLRVLPEPQDGRLDWRASDLAKRLVPEPKPGAGLKFYRESAGWTQAQLGERLGVRASFVSDLECGRRAVSKRLAKALSGLFGVSVEHFV